MPDDERPSLEAPRLFGRRRTKDAGRPADDEASADEPGFLDSSLDATAVDLAEVPDEPEPAPAPPKPRRTPRDRSKPLLPGRPAAVLTGLVVGLALLGLTWLGFQGCEAARGTTSCGTAPGMVALVIIFVAAVVVGGVLLSRLHIPDPGATSFLGTGLTGVVYLLGVDYLDNWTVLVVVPVVTAGTFLLSWWVTTTFVEVD